MGLASGSRRPASARSGGVARRCPEP